MLRTHRQCKNNNRKQRKNEEKSKYGEYSGTCIQFVRSGCGGNNSRPYARFIHVHTTTTTTTTMTHRNKPFLLLCLTTFTFLTLSRSRVWMLLLLLLRLCLLLFSQFFSRTLYHSPSLLRAILVRSFVHSLVRWVLLLFFPLVWNIKSRIHKSLRWLPAAPTATLWPNCNSAVVRAVSMHIEYARTTCVFASDAILIRCWNFFVVFNSTIQKKEKKFWHIKVKCRHQHTHTISSWAQLFVREIFVKRFEWNSIENCVWNISTNRKLNSCSIFEICNYNWILSVLCTNLFCSTFLRFY